MMTRLFSVRNQGRSHVNCQVHSDLLPILTLLIIIIIIIITIKIVLYCTKVRIIMKNEKNN